MRCQLNQSKRIKKRIKATWLLCVFLIPYLSFQSLETGLKIAMGPALSDVAIDDCRVY